MKYYGIEHKKRIERIRFFSAKMYYYLRQFSSTSKTTRQHRKELYSDWFKESASGCFNRRNYAIPAGKYCKPVALLTSDLILRENIPALKTGLKKIICKYYSHKFLGGSWSTDEIISSIEHMDSTLTWSYSSFRVGRIDFEVDGILSQYISYVDLFVRNINDAYLALEAHLYFSDDYIKGLETIINADVLVQRKYYYTSFTQNNKVSGGKQVPTVIEYNEAMQKSDELYERITSVKWLFYEKVQRFFSTVIHKMGEIPPGIILYSTDIDYKDHSADPFWFSLGIQKYDGQFIDERQKVFFSMQLSGRYDMDCHTDMVYIYNDEKVNKKDMYYSLPFQIIDSISDEYSVELFRFMFLDIMNTAFSRKFVSYKSRLANIKLKRSQLHKLLKVRYYFEQDFDYYLRFISGEDWDKSKEKVAELFDNRTCLRTLDYRAITNGQMSKKDIIQSKIKTLNKDFERKVEIIQHIHNYEYEKGNRTINCIMLAIASITLIFVIYPSWAKQVAAFLTQVAGTLIKYVYTLLKR